MLRASGKGVGRRLSGERGRGSEGQEEGLGRQEGGEGSERSGWERAGGEVQQVSRVPALFS